MSGLIKNGKIVNHDKIRQADILINNSGHIEEIGRIKGKFDFEIDASGKHVFPGLIDMHTHLRVPGGEDKEDLFTGSKAAVRGGFTTVCCMPNTDPAIDNEGLVKWIIEEAGKIGLTEIFPVGAVTRGRQGKELTDFGMLKNAGCLCLSDDGSPVRNSLILRMALEYAKMYGLLIISHCEDPGLSFSGAMRESVLSSTYGIPGIPSISETIGVFRDLEIAGYLGARIHLAHISTKESLELIRQARKKGVKVSCETAPHYFSLSIKDLERSKFNPNFKVNPPLGEEDDLAAVRKAIKDGVIDCIATDHAPHSRTEKELPFEEAPFGFTGLETGFSLAYTFLVKEDVIDLRGLTKLMSYNPAHILGFKDKGRLIPGAPADLIVVNLDESLIVSERSLISKSKNSPFIGRELEGRINYTLKRGKVVYSSSEKT